MQDAHSVRIFLSIEVHPVIKPFSYAPVLVYA